MSRITIEIARTLTNQLLQKKELELSEMKHKVVEKITKDYLKTVPLSVLNMFKEYPQYFNRTCIYGIGFHEYVSAPSRGNKSIDADWDGLSKSTKNLIKKYESLKNDIRANKEKLFLAIKGFRTFKKLEVGFPEAYKHLVIKKGVVNPPAIILDDLIQFIK